MRVVPGSGEPADPPALRPARAELGLFRETVGVWLRAGAEHWWRASVDGLPAFGPVRESAHADLHAAWTWEMERQREAGHPELTTGPGGRFTARLVRDDDGLDWWTWGPLDAAVPPGEDDAPDLGFVEDGGELPDYWREDHEAAEADIAAGRVTRAEGVEAFSRLLAEMAAHPQAS